jgi:hypothetical protein
VVHHNDGIANHYLSVSVLGIFLANATTLFSQTLLSVYLSWSILEEAASYLTKSYYAVSMTIMNWRQ